MRHPVFPLVLAALLGSTYVHPAAAGVDPYDDHSPHYGDDSDFGGYLPERDVYRHVPHRYVGPLPRSGFSALPVYPYRDPVAAGPFAHQSRPANRCSVRPVLAGAAIGGGLGAVLASDSRNRLWTLPMGAAAGGLLGGLLSGC